MERPFISNGFTLDLARGLLLKDGADVALRRKAFELLVCLARQAGRVVSKTDLIDAVWPDVIVTEDFAHAGGPRNQKGAW